jgi:hypothetical protein
VIANHVGLREYPIARHNPFSMGLLASRAIICPALRKNPQKTGLAYMLGNCHVHGMNGARNTSIKAGR